MKKIAIVGGGIAGLSAARFLSQHAHVRCFEKSNKPGGLVKCTNVEGSLFHTCGGHVWNTKNAEIDKWFWSLFDKGNDFVLSQRNSAVCMENGAFVQYPIENHIYQLGNDIQGAIVEDWLGLLNENVEPKDFDAFLRGRFGKTLYELYFKPYNRKIWQRDLSDVPLGWLDGKLPMPTVKEMILANISHEAENKFVHSSFYYPKNGGSQFIADRLAKGLDIEYNSNIDRIDIGSDGRLKVKDEYFDSLVYCGNVRDLPSICPDADMSSFEEGLANLEYHGTTAVFCEIDKSPYSWFYQPSPLHSSHRVICTGNFSETNNASGEMTCTVEFTGEIGIDDIKSQLKLMPFHPKYIAHHFSPCTYPLQKGNTRKLIGDLKTHLSNYNIHLVGRFAEWEYFNMDAVMGSASGVVQRVLEG